MDQLSGGDLRQHATVGAKLVLVPRSQQLILLPGLRQQPILPALGQQPKFARWMLPV
jgi:hypothetical protein